MRTGTPRQLIWIPVIHTQEDLGSLGGPVRRLHVRQSGRRKWQDRQKVIDQTWANIRQEIEKLNLDYGKVRIYQDSLPCCGREEEIVHDLARSGSRNHQILVELMGQGALLIGTESPELLLEEYERCRQALQAVGARRGGTPAQQEACDRILDKRDCYIAERIERTLLRGETGLLFLGWLHSLGGRLPADIDVKRLDVTPTGVKWLTDHGNHERRQG